jgi:hypothetical protein
MLYSVELPRLLPTEVLDRLIQRFTPIVKEELGTMVVNWRNAQGCGTNQKHKCTPSDKSDSAVSIHAEDDDDDDMPIADF